MILQALTTIIFESTQNRNNIFSNAFPFFFFSVLSDIYILCLTLMNFSKLQFPKENIRFPSKRLCSSLRIICHLLKQEIFSKNTFKIYLTFKVPVLFVLWSLSTWHNNREKADYTMPFKMNYPHKRKAIIQNIFSIPTNTEYLWNSSQRQLKLLIWVL